ncbi:coiled-coil domain-containing protein 39-like [Watersipora subatra]|uniref:coiled-coil domain-containing protein 39-like n=1 Tax=Watersipora subatra TaxID=2589382 RepID=UPI00355AD86A
MPASSILSEIEWDEGFSMPVANSENRHLEELVSDKEKSIVKAQQELRQNEDRVHHVSEHLRNVRQELKHTQNIVTARGKEVETEDHLLKIADREDGRLKQEIARLQKEMEELKEQKNIYENNIFKQNKKLEDLREQMNWDQQALELWLEESARKDEDAMTLAKYSREDEGKIKELTLRLSRLTDEAADRKKKLNNEMMDTQTTQIELDKAAEEFRAAHAERQELIKQWEYTIEQMQRRDREMDFLATELSKLRVEVNKREEMIREKRQFLESQENNNEEMEKKISVAERNAARLRLEYQDADSERVKFADELDALKRTVDRTNQDLETTRTQVSQLKKDIMDKQNKLRETVDIRESLSEKLKVATEAQLSAEELATRMDEMMEAEEKRQKLIEQDLKHLRDIKFKKSQELFTSKKLEKDTNAEIQGTRAAIRNLDSKINKLDHDSLKQLEIIYNQDFSIQQLERRINRMQGEHSNEEKVALEARIKELTEQLEERQQAHTLLNAQLKRLQDDIRRAKRDLEKSSLEMADLTVKINELTLYNDNSQRELATITRNKQELMVDDNLLKLEIKRLREMLNAKADDVLSLEKRKLQLETAMKERRNEINIHTDMLRAQTRAADDERQQISSELHERIAKIDKLRKRYEILMVAMAPPEGEEEKSQAYYVIKAAQEKEELQRTGDELDAKIRKAEKEIRALENTLRLMNNRNETYRKSFNKVTDTSEEMEEKSQLEEQLRAVMDKYKYKRRQTRELQEDMKTMSRTMDNLVRDEQAYAEMLEEKKNKMLQIQRELDEQKHKLDRAQKMNAKLMREIRSAAGTKSEIPEEANMDLRELREFNKTALKSIGEVVSQYPDMSQVVNMYFQQADLPPPPSPGAGGRFGSRPSSARSSASSNRSLDSVRSRESIRTTSINMAGAFIPASGRSSGSRGSAASGRSGRP